MVRLNRSTILLTTCILVSINCNAQNLDLVEGFYEILETPSENSREMLLRGDSSLVYYINEQPVVTKHDRKDAEVDKENKTLYFFFDEQGTKKLLDFTTSHLEGKLGFVYVGSLNKIYEIKEIVDNGVIEFTAQNIYKVNRQPPSRVK